MKDFTIEKEAQWTEPSFWTELCHELTISTMASNNGRSSSDDKKESKIFGTKNEPRMKQIRQRGFVEVDEIINKELVQKLADSITKLNDKGLPATFILLFDEAWELATESKSILDASTSNTCQFHFDCLAWYIKGSGFSPHRDRQPEDASKTFDNDGNPAFLTHWIALTDAKPANSCLFMIPADHDPGYIDGDNDDIDPLQRALPNKQSYQHIRAIPRTAGQSILFSHRIIHWGSARDNDQPPRVAISFVSADPTYEKPYIVIDSTFWENDVLQPPTFDIRLLLVCAQLLIYYQRFELPISAIRACYKFCKDRQDKLEPSYCKKVFYEFVQAMKEHGMEDDDDVMDAMLENQDNFNDDYEEFNDQKINLDKGSNDDECRDDDLDEDEEEVGISLFGGEVASCPAKRQKTE